jgi:hypothetical protein
MSIEAMKQALEALRNAEVVYMEQLNAMYALQQAIVEADQQEPVAWMSVDCVGERYLHFSKPLDNDPVHPLYTAPVHASDISQERVDETAKDRHEFEEMVKKGTKAWADTPDGWVDDLRGGVEIVASDHTNSHQQELTDRQLLQQVLRFLQQVIAYSNDEMARLDALKKLVRDRLAR